MKSHTKVAIIGGGIYGVALAYHLSELGWNDVILIEKGELTSGQTWHAAGFISTYANYGNTSIINNASASLYKKLAQDPELDPGWITSGSMRLIYNKFQYDAACLGVGIAEQAGVQAEIISPQRAKELNPFLNEKPLIGAVYSAGSGSVDPARVTHSIATLARRNGVEINRHTRVTAIEQLPSGEWKLITTKGEVIAEHVVNAAGFWLREVGEMVGVNVPVTIMKHQYIITEPLPEVIEFMKGGREFPTIADPHSAMYMRREQQGICIGTYETSGAVAPAPNGLPWEFDTELLDDDLDRIAPFYERCADTIPIFAKAGIKNIVSGPQIFTATGLAYSGRAPGLRNFWIHGGSAAGITQSAMGKFLAQYMIHGEAEISMAAYDPAGIGRYADREFTIKRSTEQFERAFENHSPYDEPRYARPTFQDPLYDRLKNAGAAFGEAFGWEKANWFNTGSGPAVDEDSFRHANFAPYVEAECKAVENGVGIANMSFFSKLEVSGEGANRFLNSLTARAIPENNKITLTHYLTEHGGVRAEHTITRRPDGTYYLLFASTAGQRDAAMLKLALPSDGSVTIQDVRYDRGSLLVTGPKSRELLSRLTNADLSNAAFPWLTSQTIEVAGVPVFALRVSYAGELGWELHVALKDLAPLYDALFENGADLSVTNIGLRALNSLRLEKAYRGFGTELKEVYSLDQAGLNMFASVKKESYFGRDSVLKEREHPRKTKFAYLKIENSDNDAWGDEPIYADGKLVGATTSGAFGYRVNSSIAFAIVDAEYATAGTELEVKMLGELRKAVVHDRALYDPENEKLRS
jgi:dimethylglycine dehydrogenase